VLLNLSREVLYRWREKHQELQAQTKMPRIIVDEEKLVDMIRLCRQAQSKGPAKGAEQTAL
jgi:hypothetical protein